MRAVAISLTALLVLVAAASAATPVRTVAELKAAPHVGKTVTVFGVVLGSYLCPPCPMGAMCKPCAHASSIDVSDSPYLGTKGASPAVLVIAVPDPARFLLHLRYRLEIVVLDARRDGTDARLLKGELAAPE